MSDLTPQHPQHPLTSPPLQMTITDSYSEGSYLAGLTCNMDSLLGDLGIYTVTAHIGRSTPHVE